MVERSLKFAALAVTAFSLHRCSRNVSYKSPNSLAKQQLPSASVPVSLNLPDSPSPNPIPPIYRQDPGVSDWPEQAETHPFAAEEESELGYMDDPYHEESYEEVLTPEFITSERDTLWMVEVLHPVIPTFKGPSDSVKGWEGIKWDV